MNDKLRAVLTTLGELCGMALVAAGAWMMWAPLGLVAAGVCLFVVAYVVAARP